jgi:hypothetical protein
MGDSPVENRMAITINLTPKARELVAGIKKLTGVAQQNAIERIIEWFVKRDRTLQRAILDADHEAFDAAASSILAKNLRDAASGAKNDSEQDTVEKCVKQLRGLADRIEEIERARNGKLSKKKG